MVWGGALGAAEVVLHPGRVGGAGVSPHVRWWQAKVLELLTLCPISPQAFLPEQGTASCQCVPCAE